MKFHFEKNLKKYTEVIKDSLKDLSREGKVESAKKRTETIEYVAGRAHTTPKAEQEIYDLQKKKLERLNKFKKFLERTRTFDGGFSHATLERAEKMNLPVISWHEDHFIATSPDGKKSQITLGEIMTDGEWGLSYTFDESVTIHDIRAYYLSQLKSELQEQLDKQIIISELANTRTDDFKKNAYHAIGERIEWGSEQGGVIAEKMVKNFLKKLSLDQGADFEVIDADAHQDVGQKIDFIIHRKNNEKNRGARIEESETARDIGIQFTTNTSKTEHKEHQIATAKKISR